MSYWLLEANTLARIADGRQRCADPGPALAWEAMALHDEQSRIAARDAPGQAPRNLTIAGSTAEVRVEGVLTKRPDFFAMFMGGGNTTYTSVRQALAVAATDPNVKSIVFAVDSPGGEIDGLFETLDAIAAVRATGKTMRVRADKAMSAAYGIAAAVGGIDAVGRGSTFGSLGMVQTHRLDPEIVTLTNTESPDKRPDVTTPEGKASAVKYLDQLNDEFVRAIARGRNVEASAVTEGYGRGACFTAPHALRLGMIDKIASTPPRADNNRTTATMTDEETAAARTAAEAAEQRGTTRERDRVLAHLQMGESSGDMTIALEAIRSGASMTQEVTAKYLSASMNRADRTTRQSEAAKAEAVVAGSGPAPTKTDLGDDVVAVLKASEKGFVRA
jgi:ClpP class serine protease